MDTTCVQPPELTDQQILAYLDGDSELEVVQHVKQCLYCRHRVRALQSQQHLLTNQLFRVSCPAPEELGAYKLRLVNKSRLAELQTHVESCPHCQRELAEFDTSTAAINAPQQDLVPRLRIKIAEWMSGLGTIAGASAITPAMHGVRGDPGRGYVLRTEDGLEISAEFLIEPGAAGRHQLMGLVTGLDHTIGGQLQLLSEGQHLASTVIDELGNFRVVDLSSGSYNLILTFAEFEIHTPIIQTD